MAEKSALRCRDDRKLDVCISNRCAGFRRVWNAVRRALGGGDGRAPFSWPRRWAGGALALEAARIHLVAESDAESDAAARGFCRRDGTRAGLRRGGLGPGPRRRGSPPFAGRLSRPFRLRRRGGT